MSYTRRDIGRLALTGLPARLSPPSARGTASPRAGRPDSRWAGVQVGLQVPRSLGSDVLPDDAILARCVTLGVSAIELCARPVEAFLGAPVLPGGPIPVAVDAFETGLHPLEEEVLQDEADLARQALAEQVRSWRSIVSLAPLDTLRRRYEDAGVRIEIVRWDDLVLLSDDEVDHCFRVARRLGATSVSTELVSGGPRRLGPFATRHQMFLGFHGSPSTDAAEFTAAFSHGRFNGANLDVEHWRVGGHGSPLPFLEQHASRITHVHLTDHQADDAGWTPFGEAAPVVGEVLDAMRRHGWPFQATLTCEQPLFDASTRMSSLARALDYCRQALTR